MVGDCSRLLNRALKPRGYAAYVEERLELVDLPGRDEARRPDIALTSAPIPTGPGLPADRGGAALLDLEPSVTLALPAYELLTVACIEVRHVPDRDVVTSVELLSPANKGRSRAGYTAMRQAVLATDVSLVEIDLLLGGHRPEVIGDVPPGDFCVLVSRGDRSARRTPGPSAGPHLRSGSRSGLATGTSGSTWATLMRPRTTTGRTT